MGRKSTDIKDSLSHWSKKEKKKRQTKNLQTSSL